MFENFSNRVEAAEIPKIEKQMEKSDRINAPSMDELRDLLKEAFPCKMTEGSDIRETKYYTSYEDRLKHTPNEASDLGAWEGMRGESKFIPSPDSEAGRAAKEKLFEYGLNGVEYESAEPDFSECSEVTVKIEHMTENRENYIDGDGKYRFGNFAQADIKCAELWNSTGCEGRTDWTAVDVRDWRRENKYSWHECCDTSTMQLVPREIHGVFRHSGGVAECKVRESVNAGGIFDE